MGPIRFAPAAAALLWLAMAGVPAPAFGQSAASITMPAAKSERREVLRLAPQSTAVEIEFGAPDPSIIAGLKRANSSSFNKRLEIGFARDMADARISSSDPAWLPVAGGMAAHWKVTSREAKAIRVTLDIARLGAGAEIRFWGVGDAAVYGPVTVRELLATGSTYWSPVLEGDTGVMEVFVPSGAPLAGTQVSITSVSHLFVSPSDPKAEQLAKDAGPCEVDVICRSAGDQQLANISRSVARMVIGSGGLCTGTLLNTTTNSLVPYFYTAAHCISTQSAASSLTTHWFYERTSCGGSTLSPSNVQVAGGATLLHASASVTDVAFMRLNANPPANATFSGWDAATLTGGALVGVHHPDGDVKKVSLATFGGLGPATGLSPTGSFIRANWNSTATGVVEPGSSGSGIWTGNSSAGYLFRGGLLGGPSSCFAPAAELFDYYSRFDQVYSSNLSQYLNPGPTLPEGPNVLNNPGFESGATAWSQQSSGNFALITNQAGARSGSWFAFLGDGHNLTETLSQDFVVPATQARLSFWYRIGTEEGTGAEFDVLTVSLVNPGTGGVLTNLLTLSNRNPTSEWTSTGNIDMSAFAGQTVRLRFQAVTDGSLSTDFLIDDVSVRGAQASGASNNYTALWYNSPAESQPGWGINVTQQGNIAFATLFTYDTNGTPMWLVMSQGDRQGSGDTFSGALYRTTGPVFNAVPFTGVGVTQVGTMTLSFSSANAGTLTYTFNGVTVTKNITRQVYGARAANCAATTASRAGATNYQDLWWNASESGWGVNITHQGDILFATLFTYGSNGQGMWLVMSAGQRQSDGSYFGDLYRTTGPAFNANPWTSVSVARVGNMRLRFTNGENGTLEYDVDGVSVTKSITRQVFSSPVFSCS